MEAPTTFTAALHRQLDRDPGRPLVTFYDDATGERVELSVVTYANWVAKTAGLLEDEVGLERGATALVDLPAHWLGPVWLGALWTLGVAVTDDPGTGPGGPDGPDGPDGMDGVDLVACGPDGVERFAGRGVPVVAQSLLPMAGRFAEPLPDGVLDLAEVVWAQPDAFVAVDAPGPADRAWRGRGGSGPDPDPGPDATQHELLARAAAHGPAGRVLTDLVPTSRAGVDAFLGPLLAGAGTVWVRHADPDGWQHRAEVERAQRWPER